VHSLPRYSEYQKVILSSDKDFIQLIDNKTILYRPTQKEMLNKLRIIERYGITPINFVLARSMCGNADKSDNIIGIKGIGLKTVIKKLPFLREENSYIIENVVNYCKDKISSGDEKKKNLFYEKVLKNKEMIRKNYQIMQLELPKLSIQDKQVIKYVLENEDIVFCRMAMMRMMIQDGFGEWSWDSLIQICNKILFESKNANKIEC